MKKGYPMGNPNIHYFHAVTGRTKTGLQLPHLALCAPLPRDRSKDGQRPEATVLKTGRGLLLGAPRGLTKIDGKPHLIISAAEAGQPVGDDIRAVWAGDGDEMPRFVTNPVSEVEAAVEGTVVQIGPRQYTITRRRQDDGTHLIHVRTGVSRQKGQTHESAVKEFLARNGATELGFHGSFALDDGATHVEGVEDDGQEAGSGFRPEHLKWYVSRERVAREDNIQIPFAREDVWRIPEGCKIIVADPSMGPDGLQRTFTIRVENGQLVTRYGGKRELDQFMELEIRRLKKRAQDRDRRKAAK